MRKFRHKSDFDDYLLNELGVRYANWRRSFMVAYYKIVDLKVNIDDNCMITATHTFITYKGAVNPYFVQLHPSKGKDRIAHWYYLNEDGKKIIRKLIRRFGVARFSNEERKEWWHEEK